MTDTPMAKSSKKHEAVERKRAVRVVVPVIEARGPVFIPNGTPMAVVDSLLTPPKIGERELERDDG